MRPTALWTGWISVFPTATIPGSLLWFSFVQDNMYQIGRYVEGETVFAYTPAWFDEIEVKDLTIRWNADKAGAWQPDCLQDDGYLVFSSALSPGEHYSITVAYPNDAFAFSSDRQAGSDDTESEWSSTDDDYDYNYESSTGGDDLVSIIGGLIVLFVFFVMPLMMVVRFFRWIAGGAGFGSSSSDGVSYQKKITRTKIEYYETCPGCGAAHEEGRDDCPYCGRSMIKSREVVEEKDLDKPENYSRTGTYRYGNSPNTFIHVNVINVPGLPVPLPAPPPVLPAAPARQAVPVPAPVLHPAGPAVRPRNFSRKGSTAAESG